MITKKEDAIKMKKKAVECDEKIDARCIERVGPWPSALALGGTAGVLYIVCAAAVRAFPQGAVKFFGYWFHGIDLAKIATGGQFGIGAFFAGLVSIMLFSAVIGMLFALFYNSCVNHCKKQGWRRLL